MIALLIFVTGNRLDNKSHSAVYASMRSQTVCVEKSMCLEFFDLLDSGLLADIGNKLDKA